MLITSAKLEKNNVFFFNTNFPFSIALCCSQHYSYDMRGEGGPLSLSLSLWLFVRQFNWFLSRGQYEAEESQVKYVIIRFVSLFEWDS